MPGPRRCGAMQRGRYTIRTQILIQNQGPTRPRVLQCARHHEIFLDADAGAIAEWSACIKARGSWQWRPRQQSVRCAEPDCGGAYRDSRQVSRFSSGIPAFREYAHSLSRVSPEGRRNALFAKLLAIEAKTLSAGTRSRRRRFRRLVFGRSRVTLSVTAENRSGFAADLNAALSLQSEAGLAD
jgi:hypothetical protein